MGPGTVTTQTDGSVFWLFSTTTDYWQHVVDGVDYSLTALGTAGDRWKILIPVGHTLSLGGGGFVGVFGVWPNVHGQSPGTVDYREEMTFRGEFQELFTKHTIDNQEVWISGEVRPVVAGDFDVPFSDSRALLLITTVGPYVGGGRGRAVQVGGPFITSFYSFYTYGAPSLGGAVGGTLAGLPEIPALAYALRLAETRTSLDVESDLGLYLAETWTACALFLDERYGKAPIQLRRSAANEMVGWLYDKRDEGTVGVADVFDKSGWSRSLRRFDEGGGLIL